MGGYLAGRLRSKWVSGHTDEVYFRDTAHGFLAWAVAALVTAAMLASATGAIVSGGIQASAAVAGTAVAGAMGATATAAPTPSAGGNQGEPSLADASSYLIDALFRKDSAIAGPTSLPNGSDAATATSAAEVSRIFINSLRSGTLPPDDIRYVCQIVAQRTALTQADAEIRVIDTFTRMQTKLRDAETSARETADKA